MFLITITALTAVCGAAKLDRAYLPPPPSAVTAGGSPGSLQAPFLGNNVNQRIGGVPKGGYSNDFEGVVVEAVAPGTRASSPDDTNLGAARITYGSIYSKVGEEAFKTDPLVEIRQLPKDPHSGVSKESAVDNGKKDFLNFNKLSNSETTERTLAAQDRLAETIRAENEIGPNSYKYSFETNNGILVEENAVESEGIQAMGHFQYKSDDGQVYSVTYTADSNGYKPMGDHIPTPPPIPKEILKSLEQNAREEAAGLVDDGSYDARKYNTGGDYNERDTTNGQYADKQLFNAEQQPGLLTNGEVINQNNRLFESQKITEAHFGHNKNLNRLSNENNNFVQDQSNQDNFGYKNRYTSTANKENEKILENTNSRLQQSSVSNYGSQHKNYNIPIGNYNHFPTQVKNTYRNQNIPLHTYSQAPTTLSATASSLSEAQANNQYSGFQPNSQFPSTNLNQFSDYQNSNKDNSHHTFTLNNIVHRNNDFEAQGNIGVPIVNYPISQPGFSFKPFRGITQKTQNENQFINAPSKNTQIKVSSLVVPNISSQDVSEFNSHLPIPTFRPSGTSSELIQLPLFSPQTLKAQGNIKASNNYNKASESGFKRNQFSENNTAQQTPEIGIQNSNKENIFTSENYQTQGQNFRTSQLSNFQTQASATPLHSRFPTFSTQQSNHLGIQSFQKASGAENLQSHKSFPLSQHTTQVLPQRQPNHFQESTLSFPSLKYTGELYQYNKPPESRPPPSNTDTNTNFSGELYVYNKPPETSQSSSDMSLQKSVKPSETKESHSSIPISQIQKTTATTYQINSQRTIPQNSNRDFERLHNVPTSETSLKTSANQQNAGSELHFKERFSQTTKLLPNGSLSIAPSLESAISETQQFDKQQCCQESPKPEKDLSQSAMTFENQESDLQYQYNQNLKFPSTSNFAPIQIAGQSVAGQGEVFSGPREIPRFDATGYHY